MTYRPWHDKRKPLRLAWLLASVTVFGTPHSIFAQNNQIDASFETGRQSAADNFEEEDFQTQYTYHNERLKAKLNEGGRAQFEATTHHSEKDYKTANTLSNRMDQNQAGFAYDFNPAKDISTVLGADFGYKTKRYENQPTESYNRGTVAPFFTMAQKDLYRFTVTAGFDRYDYLKTIVKDQNKYFGKVEGSRYLLDKRLTLISSFKETVEEQKIAQRVKNKEEFIGKADYKINQLLIRRAAVRVKLGQKDTKEEDERDIDFDYRYKGIQLTTYHEINDVTDTDFAIETSRKRYLGTYPGHTMLRMANGWKRVLIKNEKARWWADLTAEYKKVNFEAPADDYNRKSLTLNTVYQRKEAWKTGLGLEARRYNYRVGTDKTRYYAGLTFEKKYLADTLITETELKYRLTRHDVQNDREQRAIKAGVSYKF